MKNDYIINNDEIVLVTGANGFIGKRVVNSLLEMGFTYVRCFDKSPGILSTVEKFKKSYKETKIEAVVGDLLNETDCRTATKGVSIIYHLATGMGRSFKEAYTNSVENTKNLLDSTLNNQKLKRILTVSSFAVYSNKKLKRGGLLDESCELEPEPELSGEPYCYGKVKLEEFLREYGEKYGVKSVIVRLQLIQPSGLPGRFISNKPKLHPKQTIRIFSCTTHHLVSTW